MSTEGLGTTIEVHTVVIDDGTSVNTHASLYEEELYEILRENYGDGFTGTDGELVDFITEQGILLYFGWHQLGVAT